MILEIIAISIFLATVFNIILHKFKMPTIIGYILTWIIITYTFGLHDVSSNHDLKMIAEFWVVFLLFTIWLEFSIKHLKKMKKYVLVYWPLQVFITWWIFYLIAKNIFSLNQIESIIISLWLALSSTAIVLKTLNESWDINKKYWKKALGILLFQDIMVIPILLLITILSVNDANIWELLWQTVISAAILLAILWVSGKYFLNFFLYKVAKTKSNEIFIASILFIVIWSSALSHYFGFAYSLWAFIAGLLIAETHYKHQVEADLIPFRDLLLGFFFVTVWMQLSFNIILENLSIIFILLVSLILIKIFVVFIILLLSKNKTVAIKVAFSLFQFWEFWIVIFKLANSNWLISNYMTQTLIVIIILSMIITPFILKNLNKISDLFFSSYSKNKDCLVSKKLKNHIILIWYWRLWKVISNLLDKNKQEHIILENYINAFEQWKKDSKQIIYWSAFRTETLKSIGIEKAKAILISVWKNEKLYLIANILEELNMKWKIIIKVNNFEEEKLLKELWIKNIIVETEKTALAMIEKV